MTRFRLEQKYKSITNHYGDIKEVRRNMGGNWEVYYINGDMRIMNDSIFKQLYKPVELQFQQFKLKEQY